MVFVVGSTVAREESSSMLDEEQTHDVILLTSMIKLIDADGKWEWCNCLPLLARRMRDVGADGELMEVLRSIDGYEAL